MNRTKSALCLVLAEKVKDLALSAIEYLPMQKGASFNLEAVKTQIAEAIKKHAGE
ncbi:MAG: hypothetical protein WA183_13980 [Chthoniobacterales bacterium]